jgi:hexokinase
MSTESDDGVDNCFRYCWDSICLRPKESISKHSHSRTIDSPSKNTRFVSQAGKEVVTRDSNFDGLLHDPIEENITSILQANISSISYEDYTELMRITSPFHITVETLAHVMTIMENHCQMGLEPSTRTNSDLKMLPTYVTNLPTKNEQGEILALDLGGTNFRTLLVKLYPNTEPQVISEAHIVPDSKKILAKDLFEFIVDVLKQFMIRNQLDINQEYVLGFTFSFACEQIALNKGKFLTPSKGWTLSDLIDQDVVEKLQKIIYQKQLKVKITALINDTVGTLMACGMLISNSFF